MLLGTIETAVVLLLCVFVGSALLSFLYGFVRLFLYVLDHPAQFLLGGRWADQALDDAVERLKDDRMLNELIRPFLWAWDAWDFLRETPDHARSCWLLIRDSELRRRYQSRRAYKRKSGRKH